MCVFLWPIKVSNILEPRGSQCKWAFLVWAKREEARCRKPRSQLGHWVYGPQFHPPIHLPCGHFIGLGLIAANPLWPKSRLVYICVSLVSVCPLWLPFKPQNQSLWEMRLADVSQSLLLAPLSQFSSASPSSLSIVLLRREGFGALELIYGKEEEQMDSARRIESLPALKLPYLCQCRRLPGG